MSALSYIMFGIVRYNSQVSKFMQNQVFYQPPQVTIERLLKLEHIMGIEMRELMSFIDEK